MRESIGTVTLLNFIIIFIFIIFAFLMGTFSYYKAYKVNNYMVAAIEKYEGFNKLSYEEIENKLANMGYESMEIKCPAKSRAKAGTRNNKFVEGVLVDYNSTSESVLDAGVSSVGYKGYCVYLYKNDGIYASHGNPSKPAETDRYDTYEVTTYLKIELPLINALRMPVSSKTGRIYHFGS
jgi:hypothetical protein